VIEIKLIIIVYSHVLCLHGGVKEKRDLPIHGEQIAIFLTSCSHELWSTIEATVIYYIFTEIELTTIQMSGATTPRPFIIKC